MCIRDRLKDYPSSKWADRSAFGVARVAIRQGKPESAIKLLDRLLGQEVESDLKREILMLRAVSLRKKGDHAASLRDLEELLEQNITGDLRSDALLMAATSHVETEHPGLARQCLQSILDDQPTYSRKDQVIYQLALSLIHL